MPRTLNYQVLRVFAGVLLVVGVLGFVIPEEKSLTSGAAPYNVFHLVFGVLGVALVALGREGPIRAFNVGFGALDLYQLVASLAGLFPKEQFHWKRADDVFHLVFGAGLVLVGLLGRRTPVSRP